MAGDDGAVERFLLAWFGLSLAVFPLAATVDSLAFDGSLGSVVVLVASVVAALPGALEFHFTARNARLVVRYVVVFVVLYFLALLGQAGVYVALGASETVPAAEVAVLLATYAATYALVYRGGLARLRGAVTR